MADVASGAYKIVLKQSYFNQECFNVFHYLAQSGQDDRASDLLAVFLTDVYPALRNVQNTSVLYQEISSEAVFGIALPVIQSLSPDAGLFAGTPMNTFSCVSYRLNRSDKDTRNGAKRFVGLVEEETGAQSFGGNFITPANALATELGNILTTGTDSYFPLILSEKDGVLANSKKSSIVQSATFNNRPTTQNSRKQF